MSDVNPEGQEPDAAEPEVSEPSDSSGDEGGSSGEVNQE